MAKQELRLRDRRKPRHFWADNELLDVFGPLIGPFGVLTYMVLARHTASGLYETKALPLRDLASETGLSKDTVKRAIDQLVDAGLVRVAREKAKTAAIYELFDVKDLAAALSVSEGDRLKAALEIRNCRPRRQPVAHGDTQAPMKKSGKAGGKLFFSSATPETELSPTAANLSPKPAKNGVPLNTQETRLQEDPPTPLAGGCEESSIATLSAARVAFVGVVNAVHTHLLGSRPLQSHLADGFEEWKRFRFGDLSVAELEMDDQTGDLVLHLATPDAKATLAGLAKYRATWEKALKQFFGRDVELCPRQREAA